MLRQALVARHFVPALFAFVGTVGFPSSALAAVYYVDTTAEERDLDYQDHVCRTASGRCSLSAAMFQASGEPGSHEIVIPSGTYPVTSPLYATCTIRLIGSGSGATILDGTGGTGLLTMGGSNRSVVVSGMTLRHGHDTGSSGVGCLSVGYSTLELDDVIMEDCEGLLAGALSFEGPGGALVARDCRFVGAVAPTASGGGVRLRNGSASFERCSFVGNTAYRGGAIDVYASEATFVNCLFDGNRAVTAGAISADERSTVYMEGVTVTNNTSTGQCESGGALTFSCPATLTACVIESNIGSCTGAGISCGHYAWLPPVLIDRCAIIGNTCQGWAGGGIWSHGAALTIRNSTIADNTVVNMDPRTYGGGLAFEDGTVDIVSSTITGNRADHGGGISQGWLRNAPGTLTISGSALHGNTAGDGPDCRAESATSLGFLLIGDPSACTLDGDLSTVTTGVDPLLGQLTASYGVPVRLPLAGSPLIDGGGAPCLSSPGTPLRVDARGMSRPIDHDGDGVSACEIGAVELPTACGTDSDFDGVGDACDCDPLDPGSHLAPAEPLLLSRRAGLRGVLLSWDASLLTYGDRTSSVVAADLISALRAGTPPCLGTSVTCEMADYRRAPETDGWYYLVRPVNSCGPAPGVGWGFDSLGAPHPGCQ